MKTILLFVLSAIILSQSYGVAHGAEDIVTVATDSSSYEEGEMISVSGSVSDYVESDPFKNFDVTIKLVAPNGNIVSISQIPLNSDGSYSTFIPAQGPLWKFYGDYTISVSHGSDRNASTTFTFVLSESEEVIEEVTEEEVIEISEEELAEGCGEGTHLEDGACVLDETTEPTPGSTFSAPTSGFNALTYSIVFTLAIAFAIMIVLYLISRGSRTKTA
ncbi:hypothetical protein HX834_04650 [Marine Group I thaumarchaeote]|uniref:PEFG-CTERM sorting domain-containing protein n=1 Tax=Marine Group I thaumarchaeote TaxID=2511932 RepID=A0A7K4N056_9ARCH|nr:hypothetical protein [Marine Group I thaumarchaeote]